MSLTFADTHNMVAYLNKSDASEGFNQVIDFLNASYIKYALTINLHIYVSCIKQFWNTVIIKQSNDVTRLQALVDKKKVVITKATIRDALRLNDAEGVDCLPKEEIFAENRAYPILFGSCFECKIFRKKSSQWKSKSYCSKYIFESLVRNVDSSSKFYMRPQFIQLIIKNQLGDDTVVQGDDVHEPSIPSPTTPTPPPQQSQNLPSTSQEALDDYVALTRCVEHLEYDEVAQALEITKLKRMGRIIDDFDKDDAIDLMDDKGEEKKEEEVKDDQVSGRQAEIYQIDMDHASKVLSMQEDEPAKVQEVVDVVTTAKLITEVVTTTSESVTATKEEKGVVIRDPEEESTTIIPTDTKSKDKGKGIIVEEPKPLKKKKQVEMDEEYARKLHEELNKDIDWNVPIDHVKQKTKEDPFVQRYQVMKKMPQKEAQARKNMIMYLKNVLEEEENRAIEGINETPAQKAAKRRKLNEEVEDLKRYLEIVPDEDDDVYTEATPLARKQCLKNQMDKLKFRRVKGLSIVKNRLRAGSCWNHVIFGVYAVMDLEKNTKCLMLLVKDLVLPAKVTGVGLVLLKDELMLLSQVNTANVILMLSRQS
nr:hypothetical protein [Tanacetum cinerariifolium]